MDAVPGGPHTIFDILWGLLLAAGGFIVKGIKDDQDKLDARLGEIERSFVSRAELRETMTDVKERLDRMEGKLDRVIDRRYPESLR